MAPIQTGQGARPRRRPVHRALLVLMSLVGVVETLIRSGPPDVRLAWVVAYVSIGVLVLPATSARAAVLVVVGPLAGYYAAEAGCFGSAGGNVTQQYMFCSFMLAVVAGAAGLAVAGKRLQGVPRDAIEARQLERPSGGRHYVSGRR